MQIYNIVRKNTYYDSVTLMLISKQLKQLEGIDAVSVMMGTPANRIILKEANLLGDEGEAAEANDLIMAFRSEEGVDVDWVCGKIDEHLSQKSSSTAKDEVIVVRSAEKAYKDVPHSNLVIISVPGEYAAIETQRALKSGKNVFLFSDNVTVEQEASLKKMALEKDLIVMGPDCGTSILNGIGIGFANRVRRGSIGLVAASGTGLQEVTCLLDAMGFGISHAIGTGGRDLKEEVGAITMLQGLEFLAADPGTDTIVLISKPPAKAVADKILNKLSTIGKKAVVCFIGFGDESAPRGVEMASTLEEAALKAAAINGYTPNVLLGECKLASWTAEIKKGLAPGQKYIRALYAGGTLCYEAMLIMSQQLGPVYSNIPLDKKLATKDVLVNGHHSAIDLGDDEFTQGRPHPMIDGSLRNEYIDKVAADAETAVLLVDVVIGYGASADPAGELAPVLAAAKVKAKALGNELVIVAYVCGTEQDEQNKEDQIAKLRDAGALVASTNAEAARLSCRIVRGREGK